MRADYYSSISSFPDSSLPSIKETCLFFSKKLADLAIKIAGLECLRHWTNMAASDARKATYRNGICIANGLTKVPEWVVFDLRLIAGGLVEVKKTTCEFILGKDLYSIECMALGGAIEEIFCRFLVQEMGLRIVPRSLLNKISPDLGKVVDSKPARIFRVVFSSLFFTYLHQSRYYLDCSTHALSVTLTSALSYSILQETTHNTLYCIYNHFMHNFFVKPSIIAQTFLQKN